MPKNIEPPPSSSCSCTFQSVHGKTMLYTYRYTMVYIILSKVVDTNGFPGPEIYPDFCWLPLAQLQVADTGKVAWLQAMPITCHRCQAARYAVVTSPSWWTYGKLCQLHISHIQWFTGSKPRGWLTSRILGPEMSHNYGQVRSIFLFGFSSVYQHGWVFDMFDVFWRSGLTFWCSMSFSDCKINKWQVCTIKPQLKDLKPCHVQIGGLPRLNSKASGCGPQPTAPLESSTSSTETWKWFLSQKNSSSHDPTETYD